MPLSPAEMDMWSDDPGERRERPDDRAINERYVRGEGRIVIETNRERLPGFVNQLNQPGTWIFARSIKGVRAGMPEPRVSD